MVPGWFRAFRLELVSSDKVILRDSPTASDGSGIAPGWLRAFRLELASNDKVILRDSPTASDSSGMVPGWLRALRLEVASSDKIRLRVSPTASDGSGMVPGWLCASRSQLANSDTIIFRDPHQLRAAVELAAHLAQGQCLRLRQCAEAATLRVRPRVAELLLRHGKLKRGADKSMIRAGAPLQTKHP